MANTRRRSGRDDKPGTLDELWTLVDGIEIAMLTTRRADGHMVSRPMATQKRASGADFWFSTVKTLPKVAEIETDPRVNLSYYRDRTKEWVSVSGEATISQDRAKIRELWAPDWKIWFPKDGTKDSGGPNDPRIVLIGVKVHFAQYMTVDKPQPLVLFEIVKSLMTGKTPEMGEVKVVSMRRGAGRPAAAKPKPKKSSTRGQS